MLNRFLSPANVPVGNSVSGQPQSRDRPFIFLANKRFQFHSAQVYADEWCRFATAPL